MAIFHFDTAITDPIQGRVVFRRSLYLFFSRRPRGRDIRRRGEAGARQLVPEIRRESTYTHGRPRRLPRVGLRESKAPLHAPVRFPVIGFFDRGKGGRYITLL